MGSGLSPKDCVTLDAASCVQRLKTGGVYPFGNGWWMLIPFYNLILLFGDSEVGDNEYGPNPKGIYHHYQKPYEYDEKVEPIDDVDEDGFIKK